VVIIPGSTRPFLFQDGNSAESLLCTSAHISAVSVLCGICLIAAAVNSLFLLFCSVVGLGSYFTVVLNSEITFLTYLY